MRKELVRLVGELEQEQNLLKRHAPDSDELAALDQDLHTLRAALSVIRKRGSRQRPHPRRDQINPESNIGLTITVLREAGKALHVGDVIHHIAGMTGRVIPRSHLTSRIAKLARDGRVFEQVAPATYALTEWRSTPLIITAQDPHRRTLVAAQSVQDGLRNLSPRRREKEA